MFDKEYSFRGAHAEKVIRLTQQFDKKGNKLFDRNYDVYLLAPIVGFLYGVKADLDDGKQTTKIFPDILMKNSEDLMFHYRLILLLDKNYEPNLDERINKAFRYYGTKAAVSDELLYEEYVRGGVDKLYEKLIENSSDDYTRTLYNFIEEMNDRYNQEISTDTIIDLCALARS